MATNSQQTFPAWKHVSARRISDPEGRTSIRAWDAAQAYARLRAGTLQGRAVITPHG